MKKKLGIIPFIIVLFLVGCRSAEKDTAPVIEGTAGIECIVNSTVDLLNGVIAYDKEDGDITATMDISIAPYVNVWNGYAVFDQAGNYKVTYSVEDSQGNETTKSADISVMDREIYLDFKSVNGFYTTVAGHAILDQGGMYQNVYSIVANHCEVAEDVMLNRVYELDSGYDYTFRYFLESKTAGKIRILVDGKLADEQMLYAKENVIEFKYNTSLKNTITISLQLGALGDNIDCTLKGAEMERPQDAGLVELCDGFTVSPRFDATQGNAYAIEDGQAAKLEVTKASTDIWRAGMFLQTGIPMEIGKEYVVRFEIQRKELEDCEIALQNQQWDEKKYGTIIAGGKENKTKHTYVFTVTEETKGSLWLYVQSGLKENEVILSNLSVQTYLEGVKKETFLLSDFTNANDGFHCELETFAGGFRYFIESFGDTDYQQKITSPEFYINGSSKNFIISFKAKASSPTEVVFAAPIAGGWDPTWVWSRFVITEEERVYTFVGNESGSERENVLVWQFGSTKNQKYNNVTIEISDIKISYKNSEYDGD